MALFEQTNELMSAEERFNEVAHTLYHAARYEYNISEKYGELTDSMRQWVLNLKDLEPEFGLDRKFLDHFRDRDNMQLNEFVRLVHWMLTHYDDEQSRLNMLLDVLTTLFYGTSENEENGWHPFSKPLREIFKDVMEREVERRVRMELRVRKWKEMQGE